MGSKFRLGAKWKWKTKRIYFLLDYAIVDSGISMQTIMLALNSKGLSGCIMASIDKEKYKQILKIEQDLDPLFIIAVGKAKENIKLVECKNDDTLYYRDKNNNHCVPKRNLYDVLKAIL